MDYHKNAIAQSKDSREIFFCGINRLTIMQSRPESMGQSSQEKANMNNSVGPTTIGLNTELKRS